jgi:hypothetical protein
MAWPVVGFDQQAEHSLSVQDKPLLIYVHKDSVQHVSRAAKMPTINSHTATARVEE